MSEVREPILGWRVSSILKFSFLVRSFEYLSVNSVAMVGPDRVSPHQGEYRGNRYAAGSFCASRFASRYFLFSGLSHFIVQFLSFGVNLRVLFTASGVSGFPIEFRVC